jgi:type I restriction enzyme S subunit
MIRARFCEALHPQLVRVLWDSQHVRRQIETAARTSAGIYKVAQGDLQQLVLPVPPMTEQVEVVRLVDAQFSSIASTERDLESSAHRARALRQAILKHAFAGKLVPQDPDDEPASQLLDRIRAARAATPAAARSRAPGPKSKSVDGTTTVAKRRKLGKG